MKRISLQKNLVIVRLCIIATILVIISLFLLSFKVAERLTGDLWKQLGITEQQASEKIRNGFFYGYLDQSGTKNFRNLASGDKAAVAKDFVNYTKSYLNGTAFKAAYNKERNASRPEALQLAPVTKEAIRKQKIEEMKKSIRESEALIKAMPAIEKDVRKSIADMEKTIKEYEAPDSKMITIFYDGAVSEQKYAQDNYNKRVKEWESSYPQDPRQKVKTNLEKYLAIAATVDFDAETTTNYNRKVFVKREYESKSKDWKMIFRAGKEVYTAVKPVAEQWLKEIQ